MVENFPYPGTGIPEDPTKENPNRLTPRYTIIKVTNVKDKERILKKARKRKSFLSRNPHNAIS